MSGIFGANITFKVALKCLNCESILFTKEYAQEDQAIAVSQVWKRWHELYYPKHVINLRVHYDQA